ncbi:hypothetical protein SLA2020_000030 [Shorea laevis]
MDCLTEFSKISGLEINLSKSKLYVSPNIQSHVAGIWSEVCGIPLTKDLGTYLGVPILHDRPKASTYKHLLEKIQMKLTGWKQNLLSLAGRRILIQSVTSAIPTYTMQSILLPSSVCVDIDRMNRRFLWRSDVASKPHLVNWSTVCLPRDYGGLGLRSTADHNQALITKLGWQLISDSERPWCRALLKKYVQNESMLLCTPPSSASSTWKSILRCRGVLQLGLRWSVGSGQRIKLWQDVWVGDRPLLEHAASEVMPMQLDTTVSHVISPDNTWNTSLLRQLLPDSVVEKVLATPISAFGRRDDKVYWNGSSTGNFSVSSAFSLLQQQRINISLQVGNWRWIWKLQCLERIKFFVWLLYRGRLLTNSVRFERHFAPTPVCPRCEHSVETPLHLLRDCYYSRLFWDASCALPECFYTLDLHAWLKHNAESSLASGAPFPSWNIYFLSAIWTIWKSRNALIFDGKKISPHALQQQAYHLAMDTSMALTSNVLAPCRVPRWVRWYPPDFPFLKLNIDGAMNHSTGKATAGGLIRDHGGRWIHGFALNLGPQSSFMAELWGCRAGLQLASMLGVTHLTLEMDSLMAIRLIQTKQIGEGSASVLLSDILHLINMFTVCRVQHVLREGNSAADFMAAMGHSLPQGTTLFQTPPVGIRGILQRDNLGTLFLRN